MSPSVEEALGYSVEEALRPRPARRGPPRRSSATRRPLPRDRRRTRRRARSSSASVTARPASIGGSTPVGKRLSEPEGGQLAGNVVVLRDVTELVDARARYQEVLDAASEVIVHADLEGRWRLLSAGWSRLTGYQVNEPSGRAAPRLRPPRGSRGGCGAPWMRRSGQPVRVAAVGCGSSLGVTFASSSVRPPARPFREITGVAGILADVSSRHLHDALGEVERAIDRHVLEGGKGETALQNACDGLAAAMDYPIVWIGLKETGGAVSFQARAGRGFRAVPDGEVRWDESPEGAGPGGTAIRTGQTQIVTVAELSDPRLVARATAAAVKQVIAVPLIAPGTVPRSYASAWAIWPRRRARRGPGPPSRLA